MSANVRRTSSARAVFLSRKSAPCTRIRSNSGLSTSRSRGSHCRVVRSTHTPSLHPQRIFLVCRPKLVGVPRDQHCHGDRALLGIAYQLVDVSFTHDSFVFIVHKQARLQCGTTGVTKTQDVIAITRQLFTDR